MSFCCPCFAFFRPAPLPTEHSTLTASLVSHENSRGATPGDASIRDSIVADSPRGSSGGASPATIEDMPQPGRSRYEAEPPNIN